MAAPYQGQQSRNQTESEIIVFTPNKKTTPQREGVVLVLFYQRNVTSVCGAIRGKLPLIYGLAVAASMAAFCFS